MNPIAFLLLIPAAVLFVALFIMVFSYLAAGFNLLVKGKSENSAVKVRSGKITVMNAIAWLVLVVVAAYLVFVKFLGIDQFF